MKTVEDRLSAKPQKISEDCWYYEDKRGIDLIYEIRVNGKYIRTDSIIIPFGMIKRSMKCIQSARGND
jgi:hypothetical protein